MAARYYPKFRKFRDRHANKRNGNARTMVANCILAHKMATAAYHIFKNGTIFDEVKLLGY